jgi:hypothetical protein
LFYAMERAKVAGLTFGTESRGGDAAAPDKAGIASRLMERERSPAPGIGAGLCAGQKTAASCYRGWGTNKVPDARLTRAQQFELEWGTVADVPRTSMVREKNGEEIPQEIPVEFVSSREAEFTNHFNQ